MSRDKQIEEMCAIMADASYADCEGTPLVPESAGICDKVDCHRCKEARRLMSAGYRKASEVAREIFEEIGTLLYLNSLQGDVFTGRYFSEELETDIAELKKKYTEGE